MDPGQVAGYWVEGSWLAPVWGPTPLLFPGTSRSSLASVQGRGVRWRENYDFALGDLPGEALSCFDSCILQLGPWMLMMMEWWIMRSTMAVVTTGSPR